MSTELAVELGDLGPALLEALALGVRPCAQPRLGVRLQLRLHGANLVLLTLVILRARLLPPQDGLEQRVVGDCNEDDHRGDEHERPLAQAHRVEALGVAQQDLGNAHR